MAKKKSHNEDEIIDQQVHDIEAQEKVSAKDDGEGLKKPKLNGRDFSKNPLPKPEFEQPGTDNQKTEVIE